MALACADEPSALSVPPLGQFVAGLEELEEPAPVLEVFVFDGLLPLELHAASATVPTATSAAIERRRLRPTGFLHPCRHRTCPQGR